MDREEDYQNFVVVYKGLSYVEKLIEPYTEDGVKKTHQDIYKMLGGYQPCQTECSLQFGKAVNQWCNTCKEWKNRLARTTRIPFEAWQDVESWKWPIDFKSIYGIYLPKGSVSKPVDVGDISVSCHIWRNSNNVYKIRSFVVQHLSDARNRYFAHNIRGLSVTNNDKAKAFDAFQDVIKDPDLHGFVNEQTSLQELEKIKDGDKLTLWMNEIEERISQYGITLKSIKQTQNDFTETVNQQSRVLYDIRQNQDSVVETVVKALEDSQRENKSNGSLPRWYSQIFTVKKMSAFTIAVTVLSILAFILTAKENMQEQKGKKGCISDNYSYPYKQDLPLIGYLKEHKELEGRKWLLDDLTKSLLEPHTNTNGIAIVAEMGYGKSAIFSHLLCADNEDKGGILREHIYGFHLCRFNVKSTKYPERFIKRLVGFLATRNAEYGNIISLLPSSSILFNSDACKKEIDACFDQGITLPLKELSSPQDMPWILGLDAIDECFDE